MQQSEVWTFDSRMHLQQAMRNIQELAKSRTKALNAVQRERLLRQRAGVYI